MLGLLRMNLDDAIDGLLAMADALFPQDASATLKSPELYLKSANDAVIAMLESHGMDPSIKMNDERLRSSGSKV
jgi:hypothetical protein